MTAAPERRLKCQRVPVTARELQRDLIVVFNSKARAQGLHTSHVSLPLLSLPFHPPRCLEDLHKQVKPAGLTVHAGTRRLRKAGCGGVFPSSPCRRHRCSRARRLHLVLVSQHVVGNNLISEGYLFHFLTTAVWGRSCDGSEFGDRHTSLGCGWPFFLQTDR